MRIKGRIRAGKGSGKEIEKEGRKREERQKLLEEKEGEKSSTTITAKGNLDSKGRHHEQSLIHD